MTMQPELIGLAREWLLDCFDDDHGASEIEELSDAGIVAAVERYHEGGWNMFVRCCTTYVTPEVEMIERLESAREAGKDHGEAAASWYFDVITTDETYRRVLRGIEDGDPEILDTFPSSPLSGEWADEPTPRSVLGDLGTDEDDPAADEYLTAYEEAFHEAWIFEIVRMARFQTA